MVPHSTSALSDEDLAKKEIEAPISNITLKLVEAEKKQVRRSPPRARGGRRGIEGGEWVRMKAE